MRDLMIKGCILLLIGCFVSLQQVSAESVFEQPGALDLGSLVLERPATPDATPFLAAVQDTLDAYDIEIEEDEEDRNIYKEIAMYAVIAGAVGFVVYMLIKPDDEEQDDSSNLSGKPAPPMTSLISLPLRR